VEVVVDAFVKLLDSDNFDLNTEFNVFHII